MCSAIPSGDPAMLRLVSQVAKPPTLTPKTQRPHHQGRRSGICCLFQADGLTLACQISLMA